MIIYEKGECEHCKKISFPLYEVIKEQKVIGKFCESCSMHLSEVRAKKEAYSVD